MSVMLGKAGRATRFAPWHRRDRNAFAGFTAYAWLGKSLGLGTDIAVHLARHQLSINAIYLDSAGLHGLAVRLIRLG